MLMQAVNSEPCIVQKVNVPQRAYVYKFPHLFCELFHKEVSSIIRIYMQVFVTCKHFQLVKFTV